MIKKEDVTIIIPTMATERNEYALQQCLLSLWKSGFPLENVIVAYNGPFGGFATKDHRTVWVEDQGQCKAVNAAVATVNTPWIMVTNDDMIYAPNWFEALTWEGGTRNTLFDDPNRLCLSPMLIEPQDGAPTFTKFFAGGVGGDFNEEAWLLYAEKHMGNGVLRTGFNLPFLMKKELWDLIGGYDVNYDPWGSNSDSDLEYKIRLAGIQPYQNTKCIVYHFSQTSGTFNPENRSYWQKNWDYFIEKWGFPRTDDGIWTADFKIPYDKLKYKPFWKDFYSSDQIL